MWGSEIGGETYSTANMTGRRFHRTMEMIPALPWKSTSPSVSTPIKKSTKQGDARGASEVRRGTSSNHFHCPVPRSSSHIGPRHMPAKIPGCPAKKCGFLGSWGTYRTFWPPPFHWKTPTPPEDIRTKKFGFGFLFSSLIWKSEICYLSTRKEKHR